MREWQSQSHGRIKHLASESAGLSKRRNRRRD